MSTVDNRVIHMSFDNAKFERDIATSIKSIDKLKSSMDFSKFKSNMDDLGKQTNLKMSLDTTQFTNGIAEAFRGAKKLQDNLDFGASAKSLGNFSDQAKNFNLGAMSNSIAGVSKKFLALATIGITALAQIASQAVRTGIDMVTSLTTDPIAGGFREMETNMNSIQTILANTSSKGTTLEEVTGALDKLNEYSDRTIYNFAQMARNIGTFTAAGVDLDTSVNAIKGIANLAAISGSSADQASTAMYQLSQALAAGELHAIDWMSVVNAGMGGEIFQKALFDTGKALGTLQDVGVDTTFEQWKDAGNSFKESLESGWVTDDVLTTALQAFTGDLTAAQLQNLGYTEEQAIEMERLGKLGNAAATEVKTLTQLLGTVKEAIGTGWADSFKIIFGDFEEAKATFTDFNNIIGKWVAKSADARNKVLGDWKALGGRTLLIQKIKDLFSNLSEIIDRVQFAFHDIFPKMTGQRLFEITENFGKLVDKLDLGKEGLDRVARYASAFFTSIDLGLQIVKRFGEFAGDMIQHFTGGDGGSKVIDFFDKFARTIQNLYNTLVAGGGIDKFFDNLTNKIIKFDEAFREDPSGMIKEIAGNIGSAIGQLFDSLVFGDFHGGFLAEDSPLVTFIFGVRDKIKEGIDSIGDILGRIQDFINDLLGTSFDIHIPQGVLDFFNGIGTNIDADTSNSLEGGFDRVKGIVDKIKEGLDKVKDVSNTIWDIAKGIGDAFQWAWDKIKMIGDKVGDAFGAVWDFATNIGPTLQDAFMSDEFDQFLNLLDSLGILLGGRGLQTFGSKFGENIGANFGGKGIDAFTKSGGIVDALKTNLDTLTSTLKTMQTQIRANALLDIAKALAILTGSVLVLSFINPESLAKSLTALAVGMAQLLGAVALLNFSSGKGGLTPGLGLISITVAMNGIATAVLILAGALAVLAQLSPEDLAAGLLTIETLIVEMATAAALLKGSSVSLISGGFAMVAIATALVILSGAMKVFSTMSWEDISKGLASTAGGLLIIAGAMQLMPATSILSGPALIAVATALSIMSGAMLVFGTLSWEEIGKGMAAMGGGLLLIAGALQLMPVTSILSGPALIAVATALTILAGVLKIFATMSWEEIGKAMATLGGSLLILAGGLHLMSGTLLGAASLGVAAVSLLLLGKALKGFADMNWKQLGKGLAIMAISLGALGLAAMLLQPAIPAMLLLSVALLALGAGFALIGLGAGLLAEAFQIMAAAGTAGIDVFMYAIDQLLVRVPELVDTFVNGFILIVQSIIDALPAMVVGLGKVIAALLQVIVDNIPEGVRVTILFIQGILETIRGIFPDIVRTGFQLIQNLLHGLESNITEITDTVANIIERFLRELTNHVPDLVDAGFDLIVALLEGIALHLPELITAGIEVLEQFLLGIAQNIDDVVGAVGEIITAFIDAIGELYGDIAQAGTDAFIEFLDGMGNNIQDILRACARLVGDIIDGIVTAALILANRMADALIALLDGLTEAIRTHDDEIADSAHELMMAIVTAIVKSVGADDVVRALGNVGKDLWNGIKKGFTKAAGIFSPSKEMYKLGVFIPAGLVQALDDDGTSAVAGADLANRTTRAFNKALRAVTYDIQYMDEFNPTIAPVLDLTAVKTTAGQISGLLATNPIAAGVSVEQANAIEAASQAKAAADEAVTSEPTVRDIKIEQNNYSPEALNTARVYKQTRSLIEVTRRELEKV